MIAENYILENTYPGSPTKGTIATYNSEKQVNLIKSK